MANKNGYIDREAKTIQNTVENMIIFFKESAFVNQLKNTFGDNYKLSKLVTEEDINNLAKEVKGGEVKKNESFFRPDKLLITSVNGETEYGFRESDNKGLYSISHISYISEKAQTRYDIKGNNEIITTRETKYIKRSCGEFSIESKKKPFHKETAIIKEDKTELKLMPDNDGNGVNIIHITDNKNDEDTVVINAYNKSFHKGNNFSSNNKELSHQDIENAVKEAARAFKMNNIELMKDLNEAMNSNTSIVSPNKNNNIITK